MSIVAPVATFLSPARPRRAAGVAGFHVEDTPAHTAASAAQPVSLHTLLALQEAEGDAVQDREARRHAGSMLSALSAVQRAMLGGNGAAVSAALGGLADLARAGPAAIDPRLAAVARAIALRAAIESARFLPQQQDPAATE